MSGSASQLPSAWDDREAVAQRLAAGRPVLFLDYDGTLTPIVSRPDDAWLPAGVRPILERLVRRATVVVISGRDLGDLDERVPVAGLIRAGSHGLDISGPGGLRMVHEESRASLPDLDAAEAELERRLAGVVGALVERKRFGVAVHDRNVATGEVERVRETAADVAAAHPALTVRTGKRVRELRPAVDWHKGRALGWLLERLREDGDHRTPAPLYIGDDDTDEDALRALPAQGVGIHVGPAGADTAAGWRLDDPGQVARLLDWLARRLPEAEGA